MVPDRFPEGRRLLDRPRMQVGGIGQRPPGPRFAGDPEAGHSGGRDLFGRRGPERDFGHRLLLLRRENITSLAGGNAGCMSIGRNAAVGRLRRMWARHKGCGLSGSCRMGTTQAERVALCSGSMHGLAAERQLRGGRQGGAGVVATSLPSSPGLTRRPNRRASPPNSAITRHAASDREIAARGYAIGLPGQPRQRRWKGRSPNVSALVRAGPQGPTD
ncbi:hypothetical protein A6302_04478 [Methylobrevis pamukkalensis]|uniref:Uncharacterized protein n=1 Tax=Methylobrevis pamukkalensis TaxID=1439726 RepID=A0A1E3GPJ3_9HYPH|nr:hypothetical protein A6302_04478 [Methylobrevis pamukkalensis]